MKRESTKLGGPAVGATNPARLPAAVDRGLDDIPQLTV